MPATAPQGDLGTIERRYNEFVAPGNYSLALVEAQKLEAAVKGDSAPLTRITWPDPPS